MIISCRLGDSQVFLFRDLGVYVRAEEMASGEGRPQMGLLEIWMHFLNYAQRIYPEGVPDYKTLEWRPMKKINEATKPRTTIHLCSKAEDRPGCPALGFFHCVLFHISFCFPGS